MISVEGLEAKAGTFHLGPIDLNLVGFLYEPIYLQIFLDVKFLLFPLILKDNLLTLLLE